MKTLKDLRSNPKETLKSLGVPIYKEKQYVMLSKDDVVLASGNIDNLGNDFLLIYGRPVNVGNYYDDCRIEVRRYDLHLSNNEKINTWNKLNFDPSEIVSAYVGKPNTCMCGCAGIYYYSLLHVGYASRCRGYEVTRSEINNEKIAKVYTKMKRGEAKGVKVDSIIDNFIYTMVIGKTQYTIYLKERY